MSRSLLSPFRKKSNGKPLALSSSSTPDNNLPESPCSMALTAQSSAVAAGPSSIPSIDPSSDFVGTTDSRIGIQTLSNPANADVDVWFVHGLTGDRESTWTHANGTFTPDLVRARFPTARIISYGYDANIVGLWKNASGEGLRGHGKALAYAISNSRTDEDKRPILFIAHSLGGLVTEQALLIVLEPNEPRLRSIAPCTVGIIFMGTPHSGSYLATWGYTVARMLDRFWRANKEILSVLKQRSEVLKGVEEVFQRQLTANGALNHVKIFCFYETVAVDVVGFVVPEESATMLPFPNCGIDANHMDMTKFTGLNDAGFIGLRGVLDDWIKRAKQSDWKDAQADSVAPAATLTFNNGPVTAKVFQQGTGNAGRDINHGNVTHQSAGRDWINRDQNMGRRDQGRRRSNEERSDGED